MSQLSEQQQQALKFLEDKPVSVAGWSDRGPILRTHRGSFVLTETGRTVRLDPPDRNRTRRVAIAAFNR